MKKLKKPFRNFLTLCQSLSDSVKDGRILCALIFLALVCTSEVLFALEPSEVAVLAVKSDEDSMKIADYYMKAREIPEENLLALEKSYPAKISREVWNTELRPLIRRWLAEHPDVKCMVCAWALPLTIEAPSFDEPRQKEQRTFYEAVQKELQEASLQVLKKIYLEVAPTDESRAEAEKLSLDFAKMDQIQWMKILQKTINDARQRLQNVDDEAKKAEAQKLDQTLQPMMGLEILRNLILSQVVNKKTEVKPEVVLKIVKGVELLENHVLELNFKADSNERDVEVLKTIRLLNGPFAAVQYAKFTLERLNRNELASAFDSELSLIYETEPYPLVGWLPNMMAFQYNQPPKIRLNIQKKPEAILKPEEMKDLDAPASDEETEALPAPPIGAEVDIAPPELLTDEDEEETISMEVKTETADANAKSAVDFRVPEPKRRVLMVARLEAPSVDLVLKQIDDSIEAEENGLEGVVYLDARKTRPEKAAPGTYDQTEQALNDLAIRLKNFTDLDVRLDTNGEMFKREDCADPCALYCGWYSVNNFRDIFTFVPGAVAYHIASFEAASLKTGPSWCPNLLEHGVAATLGPTFEPYLTSFPATEEFFSLVLTGQFTMVECYYYTLPYSSWAQVFVGDPLYTPYRKNPKLKMNDLPDALQKFFGLKN
ncbi:MAG: TIGR03790 family protein [Thermoguttaceae bacterium]|nr:TIGR03790 family protein [Thermoguttaceae bacterium]